ncbi:MAG: hemolysin family protein [Acidimicrobiales bacterium]
MLILANGYFVAAEFAFVAVDRHRVERQATEGRRGARRLANILRHLSFHLSGAQLGITATSIVVGFVAEPTIARVLDPLVGPIAGAQSHGIAVFLALVLATVGQMVLGELIPKNLSIAKPERMAFALAPSATVYGVAAGPIIRFLNGAANWTVRLFGIEPKEEITAVRSLDELELVIRSSGEEGTLDPEALRLLNRTFRFRDKTASDALVARTAVTALAPGDPISELIGTAVRTGLSRFPVCRDHDLDDVVGVVHVKDVYQLPADTHRLEADVSSIMTDPFVVPETRDLASLLVELRELGSHLAVVVDEYGGTAGIITLEDVLEEIVGDISDEYDPAADLLTTIRPAGEYVLQGTLHPDEVLDATGLALPDGDYETLAGFVLDRLGRIPEPGERFRHDGWLIEVVERQRLRVATVRLVAPGGPGNEPSGPFGAREGGAR